MCDISRSLSCCRAHLDTGFCGVSPKLYSSPKWNLDNICLPGKTLYFINNEFPVVFGRSADDLGWFLEKLPQFLAFASFKGTDSNSATVVCKYLWLSAPRQTLSSTVAHFRNAFLRSSIFNRTKCSITCFKCYDQKDSLSPAFRYSKNETAFSGREPSVLNVTYVHLSTGFLLHKLFSFSN